MNDKSFVVKDRYYLELMELHKLMTELEKIEMATQQSGKQPWKREKDYQFFFDRTREGMILVQNGRIFHVSTPLSDMIGYTAEEIIGTSFTRYIHSSELPRVQKNYDNRIMGKDAPIIYKTILSHKNGRRIYVMAKVGAIVYREKQAIFALVEESVDIK